MLALTGSECAWEGVSSWAKAQWNTEEKCSSVIRQYGRTWIYYLHPNQKRTRSVSLVHLFNLIKNSVLRAVKLNHIPLRCEREREKNKRGLGILPIISWTWPMGGGCCAGPATTLVTLCSNCCPSTRTRTRETRIRNSVCCLLY